MQSLSDAELVRLCARDDEAAWRCLVERHQRLVYAVCLSAGLDADQADDVFMECFGRLLRHLSELENPARLRSWLMTTARRLSIDVLRRSRRQDSLELSNPALVDPAETAGEGLERLEQRALVQRALARLEDRCRDLLSLLYLGEHRVGYEEIGRRLDMPLGSIGPTRARCLEKLRVLYVDLSQDTPPVERAGLGEDDAPAGEDSAGEDSAGEDHKSGGES